MGSSRRARDVIKARMLLNLTLALENASHAGVQQKVQVGICAYRRLGSDCADAQSDLSL